MNELIDLMYKEFKESVSIARGIDKSKLDSIAQGKIYSGEDALTLGLIDYIGTFNTAVDVTKQLLKIDPNEHIELIDYPRKLSLFETFSYYGNPPKNSKEKDKRGTPLFEASFQYFSFFNNFFQKFMTFFFFYKKF